MKRLRKTRDWPTYQVVLLFFSTNVLLASVILYEWSTIQNQPPLWTYTKDIATLNLALFAAVRSSSIRSGLVLYSIDRDGEPTQHSSGECDYNLRIIAEGETPVMVAFSESSILKCLLRSVESHDVDCKDVNVSHRVTFAPASGPNGSLSLPTTLVLTLTTNRDKRAPFRCRGLVALTFEVQFSRRTRTFTHRIPFNCLIGIRD